MTSFEIGGEPVPIVFCYIGEYLPDFVIKTANFAALKHPDNPVYLLTSKHHTLCCTKFRQFVCTPPLIQNFLDTLRYKHPMPKEWVECVFSKWFYIADFLAKSSYNSALLLDSDILFYDHELMANEWIKKNYDAKMLIVPAQKYRINNKSRPIASCHAVLASSCMFGEFTNFLQTFFSDPIELEFQDKYISELKELQISDGIGDMFAIDRFQKINQHKIGFFKYSENNMNAANGYKQFLGLKLFTIRNSRIRLYPIAPDVPQYVSFLHFQGVAKLFIEPCIKGGHYGVRSASFLGLLKRKIHAFVRKIFDLL